MEAIYERDAESPSGDSLDLSLCSSSGFQLEDTSDASNYPITFLEGRAYGWIRYGAVLTVVSPTFAGGSITSNATSGMECILSFSKRFFAGTPSEGQFRKRDYSSTSNPPPLRFGDSPWREGEEQNLADTKV
jgi:hypothetical protein